MYVFLIILLLTVGGGLLLWGLVVEKPWRVAGGVAVLLATGAFFALLSFWGEMLWFYALGHAERFWTANLALVLSGLVGTLAGWVVVYLVTWSIPEKTAGRADLARDPRHPAGGRLGNQKLGCDFAVSVSRGDRRRAIRFWDSTPAFTCSPCRFTIRFFGCFSAGP